MADVAIPSFLLEIATPVCALVRNDTFLTCSKTARTFVRAVSLFYWKKSFTRVQNKSGYSIISAWDAFSNWTVWALGIS